MTGFGLIISDFWEVEDLTEEFFRFFDPLRVERGERKERHYIFSLGDAIAQVITMERDYISEIGKR